MFWCLFNFLDASLCHSPQPLLFTHSCSAILLPSQGPSGVTWFWSKPLVLQQRKPCHVMVTQLAEPGVQCPPASRSSVPSLSPCALGRKAL